MQTGTVKAWIEARGMGFIAPTNGGEDLFVHRSSLVDGQSLAVGASVTFESGWDDRKGKSIAINCSGAIPQPGAPTGTVAVPGHTPVAVSSMAGCGAGAAQGYSMEFSMANVGPPAAGAGFQMGTVKAWLEEKGFGFVTPDDNSGDVFVHRSSLQDGTMLLQGARVQIEAAWDEQKGKPIASRCIGATASTAGAAGGAPMVSGTVKVWFEDKGFGFISNDDGSGDAFVHRCALADGQTLYTGQQVWFEAQWNAAKQKSTAIKVVGCNAGTSGAAVGPSPQGPMDMSGGGGCSGPGWDAAAAGPDGNLFIAGLPMTITEETIRNVFGPYGAIKECKLLPDNGKPDKAALVRFCDVNQAKWIVENLNLNIPVGLTEPIHVRYAQKKNQQGPPSAASWAPPAAQAPVAGAWGGDAGWGADYGWGAPAGGVACQNWGSSQSSTQHSPAGPSDNLFISGLPLHCDENLIRTVFGPYGTVLNCKVLPDNGRQDRAALVQFGQVSQAQWIVDNLNLNMPVGLDKPIQVKFAQAWAGSGQKGAGKGDYGKAAAPASYAPAAPYAAPQVAQAPAGEAGPSDNLFIAQLPESTTEESLKMIFGPYGQVISCKVLPDNGKPDKAALLRMGDISQAKWLVENLHQNIPVGLEKPISVRYAQNGGATSYTPDASAQIVAGGPQTGVVKVWMEERGMGFITPSSGGQDLFVHRSQLVDGQTLTNGAAVMFEAGWDQHKGKPIAKNVSGALPQSGGVPSAAAKPLNAG